MTDELAMTAEPTHALAGASELRHRFDGGATRPRMLALVSPTCPVCLEGVALVAEGLRERAVEVIDVHVVWMPVLEADSVGHATAAAEALGVDGRLRHYWDPDREISAGAHAVLDLERHGRSLAWDVYLFYRGGVRWRRRMPVPDTWLHQLRIADQPSLDTDEFRRALDMVIA